MDGVPTTPLTPVGGVGSGTIWTVANVFQLLHAVYIVGTANKALAELNVRIRSQMRRQTRGEPRAVLAKWGRNLTRVCPASSQRVPRAWRTWKAWTSLPSTKPRV